MSITQGKDDPIIGLDVCGKELYYCRQSTLESASNYFAARFKGNFDPLISFVDSHGRTVYFVERPPNTFKYIFDYMITGSTHNLPSFRTNPNLVRSLRIEAEYFGVEGLSNFFKVSFVPAKGNKGILYWLGTEKGEAAYKNPLTIGAIDVSGWMDDVMADPESNPSFDYAYPRPHRASFVHHQESVEVFNNGEGYGLVGNRSIFGESHATKELPVDIDLKTVMLRPTHYSMRVSWMDGDGMRGQWVFAASQDGIKWDKLHDGRSPTEPGANDKLNVRDNDDIKRKLRDWSNTSNYLEFALVKELATCYLEQECREIWKLEPAPSTFYRYFRIFGVPGNSDLHGEGIELFGDVYEE